MNTYFYSIYLYSVNYMDGMERELLCSCGVGLRIPMDDILVHGCGTMKKKSAVQIGDEREEKFRDLRISQGYVSQKRNRQKYKKNDVWVFDVISMNKDGIEFAQVKGPYGYGAATRIKEWIEKNRAMLPENAKFIMAYYTEELGTFRIVEVK